MTVPHEIRRQRSLARLLNLPGPLVERAFWKFFKVNRCELDGSTVVLHRGLFSRRRIAADDISSWAVYPEMGFDAVRVNLAEEEFLIWPDKYGDLIGALEAVAPSKRVEVSSLGAAEKK